MPSFHEDIASFVYKHTKHMNMLYHAVSKDDPYEAVTAALALLKKTRSLPKLKKTCKNEKLSISVRQSGNEYFLSKDYNRALSLYNLAIGSAPKNSESIAFAYSNRSALFLKVKAYSAALDDINICLSMKCPLNIENKLMLRREECLRLISEENKSKNDLQSKIGKEFFKLKDIHDSQIPCVSSFVNVISDGQSRKIVAAKDIPSGSLVGIETPFASHLDVDDFCNACHHCHKFVLNLIPCDTCCETYFCSNSCKETSYKEYHNIECQLIDMVTQVLAANQQTAFKAALKIKMMCKTWEELILATSKNVIKKHNSVKDLHDSNSIYSVLNGSNDDKHFVFGQKFNDSLLVATLIFCLEKIPGFFPFGVELKQKAVRAFSRMLMHLLSIQMIETQTAALTYPSMDVATQPEESVGIFSFLGKLKHACEPSLILLGLDNRVAMVAIRTIPKGEELTISLIGHWFDQISQVPRSTKVAFLPKPVCQCRVCLGNWNVENVVNGCTKMTEAQNKFMKNMIIRRVMTESCEDSLETTLKDLWRGLDLFRNIPNTKQYLNIYMQCREYLCQFQYLTVNNEVINMDTS